MIKAYNCPKCNAPLVYDENFSTFFCSTCGEYYYQADFEKKEENNQFTGLYNEIDCKMCGKQTIVSKNFNYDLCPFCYNNLIDINEGVRSFYPEAIIPFKETKESLLKNFMVKAKNAGVPNIIVANLNFDTFKGLYIPFNYYVIENSADTFMQTRDVNGDIYSDFYYQKISYVDEDIVLVDTSKFIASNQAITDFADYNLKELKLFSAKLLGDFFTMKNTINDSAAWSELCKIVKTSTEEEVKTYKDKYEEIKEVTAFNKLKNNSKKSIVLPVWVFEYTLNDEKHYLYINGQTGTMASDIHFDGPQKAKSGGLFSKKKEGTNQVRVKYRDKFKREEYRTKLDFMNEMNKYQVNKNDRLSAIRKTR